MTQIHDRIVWRTSQTEQQICVWCGELMTKGERAISMKNKPGSQLSITKNLWIHAKCRKPFGSFVRIME